MEPVCRANTTRSSAAQAEAAATIDTVVMDKTGTLTTGQFAVSRLAPAGEVPGAIVSALQNDPTVDYIHFAFDGLTIVSITGILFAALAAERGIYLDVALVYALLSFLGVIVVARFLERGF